MSPTEARGKDSSTSQLLQLRWVCVAFEKRTRLFHAFTRIFAEFEVSRNRTVSIISCVAAIPPRRHSNPQGILGILIEVVRACAKYPRFFILDKLLLSLNHENAGVSFCNLYLGDTAHADDAQRPQLRELQNKAEFASENVLKLNASKIEVVSHTFSASLCSNNIIR